MARQDKIGSHATTVKGKNTGNIVVTYHETDVVTVTDTEIKLDSGGWQTKSTKDRMNQASRQFGLGFTVVQRKGEWYVQQNGQEYPFDNALIIPRLAD